MSYPEPYVLYPIKTEPIPRVNPPPAEQSLNWAEVGSVVFPGRKILYLAIAEPVLIPPVFMEWKFDAPDKIDKGVEVVSY